MPEPTKFASIKKQRVHSSASNGMAKKSKRKKADEPPLPVTAAASEATPQPQRPSDWGQSDWLWAAILILGVFLAYLPVWHAGFMWDDDKIVTDNPCIVGPLGLKAIWTTSAARFYPLVLSTFWLEHAMWGLSPLSFHLVSLFLHMTSAIVLWRLLKQLEVPGAWFGAALWALHPVQVETVAWISETKNTESCLFFLLTILFFVKGLKCDAHATQVEGRWNYAFSLVFAALAMASKSSTLLLPLVLALCTWWVTGRWRWRDMAKVLPVLLMTVLAGAIMLQIVQKFGGDEMHWAQSWPQRIATAGYIFWFYLGKLICPHPLVPIYDYRTVDASQWISYLPIASLGLTLAILYFKRQSWSRGCLFALVYYLLNLVPVMGLFSVTGFRYSIVEDHLQYLASIGPLALAGAGLSQLMDFAMLQKPWLQAGLCSVLLLCLGVFSWRQAWIYQNPNVFWTYTLSENRDCWLAYNDLGVESALKGETDKAIAFYWQSLAIFPYYALTHSNLGVSLEAKGQTDEAISEYKIALALDPALLAPHLKLGEALSQQGDMDEAIAQYQMALAIDPASARAHNNLGAALFRKGDVAEAVEHYKAAVGLDADMPQIRNNLGLALTQMGVLLLQAGRTDEAVAQFQEALHWDSTIVQAHSDLGIVLAQKGQLNEALAQFQEAVRLQPADNAAQVNLAKIKAMLQQNASSQ
jgi:tetratricopeptide (TPR) repeat protein